jgi:hypothetical protein
MTRRLPAAGLALLAVLGACGGPGASRRQPASAPDATAAAAPAPAAAPRSATLAAAGDIACQPGDATTGSACHQAATAGLLGQLRPTAVAALGDVQYETGALDDFRRAYASTWGRLGGRVHPAPGNHEYGTPGASGYFDYFGAAAGPRSAGYYAYDVGPWRVISLNSNCDSVSCARGSRQQRWLARELVAHRRRCVLAYWHHPRFSSGLHGDDAAVAPLWRTLYDAGADVVLSGHDHDYERFAPQDPSGRADTRRGIREFVVGTGGRNHYPLLVPHRTSQRRNGATFGVLLLTLRSQGYDWRFVPEPGASFSDRGSGSCH